MQEVFFFLLRDDEHVFFFLLRDDAHVTIGTTDRLCLRLVDADATFILMPLLLFTEIFIPSPSVDPRSFRSMMALDHTSRLRYLRTTEATILGAAGRSRWKQQQKVGAHVCKN